MELKEIKDFIESAAGKAVKQYFTEVRTSLRSMYRIKDLDDPIELAIELKAQKKALLIIEGILDDIMIVEREKVEKRPEEDSLTPGV